MIYCEGLKCTDTGKTTPPCLADVQVTLPVQLLLHTTITLLNPRAIARTSGMATNLTPIDRLTPGIVILPELTDKMSPVDLVYTTVTVHNSNSAISVPTLKEMANAQLQCFTGIFPAFASGN